MQTPDFPSSKSHVHFPWLRSFQRIRPSPWSFVTYRNYCGELLAPRPNPKLEDNPLLAVRYCLFNIYTDTLHIWRLLLHPQPEDAPCHSDKGPTYYAAKYPRRLSSLCSQESVSAPCTEGNESSLHLPNSLFRISFNIITPLYLGHPSDFFPSGFDNKTCKNFSCPTFVLYAPFIS
jgi:hypothetical protein